MSNVITSGLNWYSLHRGSPVRRSSHHLNHRILLQDLGDQSTYDDRIVHDHHANSFSWLEQTRVQYGHVYVLATRRIPTSSSFPRRVSVVLTSSLARAPRTDAI